MEGDEKMATPRTGADDDPKIPVRSIENLAHALATDKFLEFNDQSSNFFFSQASGNRRVHDDISSRCKEKFHWQ